MPAVDWTCPHTLTAPRGSLNFNTAPAGATPRYVIQPDGYRVGPAGLRASSDQISQQDGVLLHPRFKDGYTGALTVEYEYGFSPACGSDLVNMDDALLNLLDSLLVPTSGSSVDQRLLWTPPGHPQRMLDEILVLGWGELTFGSDGSFPRRTFTVESPFPYALTSSQNSDGLGATVNNAGTAKSWPVIRVNAGATSFTITNTTTGLSIVYAGAAITSTYLEIDAFRGTAFQDNGVSRLSGFDPTLTDMWWLEPGSNVITISGATATMLWNVAWA